MSILVASALAMVACQLHHGGGVDANIRAARQFVEFFNEGRFREAGDLFDDDAVVHSIRDEDQMSIRQILRRAEQASAAERARFRVRDVMDDGSNTVALELVESDSTDEVGDIWVFDVGSGCIQNVWRF